VVLLNEKSNELGFANLMPFYLFGARWLHLFYYHPELIAQVKDKEFAGE